MSSSQNKVCIKLKSSFKLNYFLTNRVELRRVRLDLFSTLILCFLCYFHFTLFFLSFSYSYPIGSKLNHVEPFGLEDGLSSYCNFKNCRDDIDATATLDISIPHVSMATQQFLMIVDPPPPYFHCVSKSTQLSGLFHLLCLFPNPYS